jgi:hypothetical protein
MRINFVCKYKMPLRFPAPPLKVKEPKTVAHTFTTPSYSAIPKYGDVFGKHFIPSGVDVPKLNVS